MFNFNEDAKQRRSNLAGSELEKTFFEFLHALHGSFRSLPNSVVEILSPVACSLQDEFDYVAGRIDAMDENIITRLQGFIELVRVCEKHCELNNKYFVQTPPTPVPEELESLIDQIDETVFEK